MITVLTVIGIKGKEEEYRQEQAKGKEEEQETWRQWYSCRELLRIHQKTLHVTNSLQAAEESSNRSDLGHLCLVAHLLLSQPE